MHINDIKPGMNLKGVANYADGDCISVGKVYEVLDAPHQKCIVCNSGDYHDLGTTVDDRGRIPELEPAYREGDLKVWWVPQLPMDAFEVPVKDLVDAVRILDLLADYDLFQFNNSVKPDYCNVGGLKVFVEGEWVDWADPETDEDDPRKALAEKQRAEALRENTGD